MRMAYRKNMHRKHSSLGKKRTTRNISTCPHQKEAGNGITILRRNVALTIISDYELLTFRSKINTYLKERLKRLDTVKAIL